MRFPEPETTLDPVILEVQWQRLITIMDETDRALKRTSFSTIIGESGDFACILMDENGVGLAQSNESTTFFTMTLPRTTRIMLERFPPETLSEGDVLLTNDPWLVAGHLPDFQLTSPIFYCGRIIGFIGIVAHMPDVGGKAGYFGASEIYEEGLRIPPCKVFEKGKPNEDLLQLIAKNVRVPEQVIGDIRAIISAHHVGKQRLIEFIRDYDLVDLRLLATNLLYRSERAMRNVIAEIPDGVYKHKIQFESFGTPNHIIVAIIVSEGEVTIDLTGTSPQRDVGAMNCTYSATLADAYVCLKATFLPHVPNNEGALNPFSIVAPEGCFFNCQEPAAVKAREVANVHLHDAIFGALAKVVPDLVHAGAGTFWSLVANGIDDNGERYNTTMIPDGGMGASAQKDGLGTVRFPGNGSAAPTEVLENMAPLLVVRKELATDSAGAGKFRGGIGQQVVISGFSKAPVTVALVPNHFMFPPPGIAGGNAGALGTFYVNNETPDILQPQHLDYDDTVVFNIPGGGGFGNPLQRDPSLVAKDVSHGYVSPEEAYFTYGVVLDPDTGIVDEEATVRHRER